MLHDFPEMRDLRVELTRGRAMLLTDKRFLFGRMRKSWKRMVVRVAQL